MTLATAYWCVLVAALLPYVWTIVAKGSGDRFDNRDPRGWLARQDNPRSIRANAAQLNAFEAFPPFAIAVVLAQLAAVSHEHIALLTIAFIIARILHGVFYIANLDKLRSLVWAVGLLCVVTLLALAALAVNT
ncbi:MULTISPECIES: MAPEG family protein [unclassified Lysobacter]